MTLHTISQKMYCGIIDQNMDIAIILLNLIIYFTTSLQICKLCFSFYSWNIELLKQTDIVGKPVTGQVNSRGNLMYKAEKGLGPMPILMISLTNPAPKVSFANETYSSSVENQLI